MPRKNSPPTEMKLDKTTNRAYVRWNNTKTYFGKWGSIEASQAFIDWYDRTFPEIELATINTKSIEDLTVNDCIRAYNRHARKYYSPGEHKNIRQTMKAVFRRIGDIPVLKFGPKRLKALQTELIAAKNKKHPDKQQFCRNVINAHIHRLKRCFRWCATEEMIPAEIVAGLLLVPNIPKGRTEVREKDRVLPVPIGDVLATLPFLSPTNAAMVQVQTLCGMRPQDVCGMSSAEIDKTKDIWIYRPSHHKNAHHGHSLVKAIPPEAQEILNQFTRPGDDEPFFSPADTRDFWLNVLRNFGVRLAKTPARKQYTTQEYGRAISCAIRLAAKSEPPIVIPHWSPNRLRHLIGTHVRSEAGIEASQLVLGHARMDSTAIYAEATEKQLSAIARSIPSLFETKNAEHQQP